MQALVSYLVAAMSAWVPPYAQPEPKDDTLARYEAIARDAITVAFDEAETPLFPGQDGRAQTALLMLSVASFESGYRHTVDTGIRLGDNGRSYCLMQIRVGHGITTEGWSGEDLVNDRTKCFHAGLRIIRGSFNACRKLAFEDRMSAYTSGRCLPNEEKSHVRVGRSLAWWDTHARPDLTPAPI